MPSPKNLESFNNELRNSKKCEKQEHRKNEEGLFHLKVGCNLRFKP
jgi:hypothetical protein